MKKEEKTHWKKNFNYDYMGAYSLPEGKDVIVTIKETKKEMVKGVKGKKEECFICYFTDSEKPMILNRTNCKMIEKLYGTPFIEEWKDKKIQLYSAKVDVFGETTDGLRIRDFKPEDEPNNAEAVALLNSCKDLASLQKAYLSLSKMLQGNKDVIKLKDNLKEKFKSEAK